MVDQGRRGPTDAQGVLNTTGAVGNKKLRLSIKPAWGDAAGQGHRSSSRPARPDAARNADPAVHDHRMPPCNRSCRRLPQRGLGDSNGCPAVGHSIKDLHAWGRCGTITVGARAGHPPGGRPTVLPASEEGDVLRQQHILQGRQPMGTPSPTASAMKTSGTSGDRGLLCPVEPDGQPDQSAAQRGLLHHGAPDGPDPNGHKPLQKAGFRLTGRLPRPPGTGLDAGMAVCVPRPSA